MRLQHDKAGFKLWREVQVWTAPTLEVFPLLSPMLNHCKQIFAPEKYPSLTSGSTVLRIPDSCVSVCSLKCCDPTGAESLLQPLAPAELGFGDVLGDRGFSVDAPP